MVIDSSRPSSGTSVASDARQKMVGEKPVTVTAARAAPGPISSASNKLPQAVTVGSRREVWDSKPEANESVMGVDFIS